MNDRHYEKMSEAELSKKLGQYQKQARIWTIIGLVGVLGGVISFFAVDDMALKSILTAVLFFGGVCASLFLGGGAQKKLKALMQEQMGDFFRAELENAFGPDMHTAQILIDEKLVRSLRLLDGQWEEIETENFREGEHNGAHFSAANVRLNHVYERGRKTAWRPAATWCSRALFCALRCATRQPRACLSALARRTVLAASRPAMKNLTAASVLRPSTSNMLRAF